MDCDSDAVVLLDHDVPAVRLQAHHGGIGWVRGELGCLLGKHRDDTSVLIRQGSSAWKTWEMFPKATCLLGTTALLHRGLD